MGLGIDVERIPDAPSKSYDQILEGIATGSTRALWVIATNTAHSWINQTECRELLGRLDFLVVQDLYADTETCAVADLVLPAAGWGEKDGTFINSERRIGPVKQVLDAPGEAMADFWIFKALADRWGCAGLFAEWTDPEAVFRILQRCSVGQPCDISGIDGYGHLDDAGGVQWPLPAGTVDVAKERRLFADGRFPTPDGRARFVVDLPRPPAGRPDARFPLVLLTGRGSTAQWHTQTRTRRSDVLSALGPDEAWVEVHPADAAPLAIDTGDRVRVVSARGSVAAFAVVTEAVGRGRLFMPMHDEVTNRLTFPAFDPHSRQPSYKYCAVAVRPEETWESLDSSIDRSAFGLSSG